MAMKLAMNTFQTHHPITHYSLSSYHPIPRIIGTNKRPGLAPRRSVTVTASFSGSYNARNLSLDRSRGIPGSTYPKEEPPCPIMLGIRPDTPEWPERAEATRISMERRASRVDIPLSIRMIKMKQRHMEVGLGMIDDAMEGANCSVRRAFSSFALIIRELQTYAVHMTEKGLGIDELKEIVCIVQREINASLVWLFRQVFSQTPTLMIYLMILLANFSVYSMIGDSAIASPMLTLSDTLTENEQGVESLGFTKEEFSLTVEEEALWKDFIAEVEKMKGVVLDEETLQGLVAPVTVNVDREEQEEKLRADMFFQMMLSYDPDNSLLLCNYARFLAEIVRNFDRAEEYFLKAMQAKQPDPEAFLQYADFLFQVRDDLWGAEECYQQAMDVERRSHFYAAQYANFLWGTGAEDTCFPLDTGDDPFDGKSF